MKIKITFLIAALTVLMLACKMGVKPTVTTDAVTSITMSTAICGGNVTSDGGEGVSAKGICWAKSSRPNVDSILSVDGLGTGPYKSYLTLLHTGTKYYVRAYAKNKAGTAYGEEVTFTTY
jgi:hypothetical protein